MLYKDRVLERIAHTRLFSFDACGDCENGILPF